MDLDSNKSSVLPQLQPRVNGRGPNIAVSANHYFFFSAGFIAIGMLFCAVELIDGDLYTSRKSILIAVFAVMLLVVGALYLLIKNNQFRVETVFLVLFCSIGCISFALPPFTTPDSSSQFYRAYEIANGQFVTNVSFTKKVDDTHTFGFSYVQGDIEAPGGMQLEQKVVNETRNRVIHPEKVTTLAYSNMGTYSPVAFLPSVVGIFLSRAFTNNYWIIVYSARIATFLFAGVLLYLSIKVCPIERELLCLFCFNPVLVELYTSMSPDVIAFVSSTLLFCYCCKLRTTNDRVNIAALITLCLLVSLSKIVYLPLCAFLLLIPSDSFSAIWHGDSLRSKRIVVITVICISVIANLLWLKVATRYLLPFNSGVSAKDQLNGVISHPFIFILVIVRSIINYGEIWFKQGIGCHLGWANIISPMAPPLMLFSAFLGLSSSGAGVKSEKGNLFFEEFFDRLLIAATVFITAGLIFLSLYLQWTPVGSNLVEGIQGRYFYPLIFPLCCLVSVRTKPLNLQRFWVFVTCCVCLCLMPAIIYFY